MKDYGIQLYSLRDISKDNFELTLKTASEIGYTLVESAGFFGHSAEEVKQMLKKYNLKISGTHTAYNLLTDDFENTVKFHKDIGCMDLIIPGAPKSNKEEIDRLVENINKWQPLLEKEGIRLHYHNHHQEFMPNPDGSVTMDELEKRTNVLFELDTYWAFVAGADPVKVLDKYDSRIKFIHLKDGTKDKIGKSLGMGEAPVTQVLEKAEAMGKIIIVESEGLEPTGKDEVKRCMDMLIEYNKNK